MSAAPPVAVIVEESEAFRHDRCNQCTLRRGSGGGGGGHDPAPLLSTTNFFFSTNFLTICGWRHTGNVQGGGACECPRVGVFFNFFEGG